MFCKISRLDKSEYYYFYRLLYIALKFIFIYYRIKRRNYIIERDTINVI